MKGQVNIVSKKGKVLQRTIQEGEKLLGHRGKRTLDLCKERYSGERLGHGEVFSCNKGIEEEGQQCSRRGYPGPIKRDILKYTSKEEKRGSNRPDEGDHHADDVGSDSPAEFLFTSFPGF